jgi:hypothetical protein
MKENKNLDPIIVYWSPHYKDAFGMDWNILYSDPEQLYKKLNSLRDSVTPASDNILSCPASTQRLRSTFAYSVMTKTDVSIIKDDKGIQDMVLNSKQSVGVSVVRGPSLKNNNMIRLSQSLIFFTEEESLTMHVNPPFWSNSSHLKYGAVVSGGFDIGKWFRPVVCEMNLWEDVDNFVIEAGEDLVYFEFLTDRPIILKRFVLTPELFAYSEACMASNRTIKQWMSMSERYEVFRKTRMKDLVLKEIKKNILGE